MAAFTQTRSAAYTNALDSSSLQLLVAVLFSVFLYLVIHYFVFISDETVGLGLSAPVIACFTLR